MQHLTRRSASGNGNVHTGTQDEVELDPNDLIPDRRLVSFLDYDDYFNGDIYEPSKYEQSWEINTEKYPYLRHIKSLSAAWPHLRYLAQWMEVTTSPTKWQLIKDLPQQKLSKLRSDRAEQTNIATVDFISGQPAPIIDYIKTPESLVQSLDRPAVPGASRLYVVEDLSRDVIECLGSKLDIDPLFFREHINDYTWYNTRDPWVELPDLDIVSRDRPYFHLTYNQPRYFKTPESFNEAQRQAGRFNVLRRLDADDGHESPFDEKSATVALVRSKASLWIRPAKTGQQAIGVLLIDPSITEGHPLWGGYRPFKNSPTPGDQARYDVPPKTTLFQDLLFWIQQTSQQDIDAVENNPRAMAFRILEIICAEWLTLSHYITARLGQIEWEIESPKWFEMQKQELQRESINFNMSLKKLHTWRRRLPIYSAMVADTRAKLFSDEARRGSDDDSSIGTSHHHHHHHRRGGGGGCVVDELEKDFALAAAHIRDLLSRTERIAAVATAVAAIEESRRALEQNRTLGRLTYLAVIFAPLSFVSSFFSMSADVAELAGTIWVFFCVAVPVSLLVYLAVDKNWSDGVRGAWGRARGGKAGETLRGGKPGRVGK
ncbi:uncharacterized protein F4812DRAFT_461025 [Daldinia caldariorum]|uniref:uncharacterized protein n=1 Tax=Daldinia caldariorum TaxID=326644 RepID=UPI002007F30D|nr:uncharacterized protein F4812DRAFT_461025 [Daldinia caldariorum]KAI1466049.1 hypothetical protein F4812DRAFT_461025 [Daldinia caldariorum]